MPAIIELPSAPLPTSGWTTRLANGLYVPHGSQFVRSGPGKNYRSLRQTTRPFEFKAWYIDWKTGDIWLGDIGMCNCMAYRIGKEVFGGFDHGE